MNKHQIAKLLTVHKKIGYNIHGISIIAHSSDATLCRNGVVDSVSRMRLRASKRSDIKVSLRGCTRDFTLYTVQCTSHVDKSDYLDNVYVGVGVSGRDPTILTTDMASRTVVKQRHAFQKDHYGNSLVTLCSTDSRGPFLSLLNMLSQVSWHSEMPRRSTCLKCLLMMDFSLFVLDMVYEEVKDWPTLPQYIGSVSVTVSISSN